MHAAQFQELPKSTFTLGRHMIPFAVIRQDLFDVPKFAERVRDSYGVDVALTGHALEQRMFADLQMAVPGNGSGPRPTATVFKAAVLALASNMRNWSQIHLELDNIRRICLQYEPAAVAASLETVEVQLRNVLKGPSGRRNDCPAVIRWAQMLDRPESFGEYLQSLDDATRRFLPEDLARAPGVVTAMMAALLGTGIRLPPSLHPVSPFAAKVPGMGPTLASEFLRNLGWPGFKPDRHVMRLFDYWRASDRLWDPLVERARAEVDDITRRLPQQSNAIGTFLFYSRLGELASPADMPLSRADQLVWLYGAFVLKKRDTQSGTMASEVDTALSKAERRASLVTASDAKFARPSRVEIAGKFPVPPSDVRGARASAMGPSAVAFVRYCEGRVGEVISRKELVEGVAALTGWKESAIGPQCFCYNRINVDVERTTPLFEWVGHGQYRYLGPDAPYSGLQYWRKSGTKTDVIVGEWISGEFSQRETTKGAEAFSSAPLPGSPWAHVLTCGPRSWRTKLHAATEPSVTVPR